MAEQQRIMTKVEELMALLDRLESAQTDRRGSQTALLEATLPEVLETEPATPR